MKRKLVITALLTAVSGLAYMQNHALANDADIAPVPDEYCQYKLELPLHIEDPECINIEPAGAPYSS